MAPVGLWRGHVIAGELHDTIGHGLTALQLQLEALSHDAPDSLRRSVLGCKALAADLLEDLAIRRRRGGDAVAGGEVEAGRRGHRWSGADFFRATAPRRGHPL